MAQAQAELLQQHAAQLESLQSAHGEALAGLQAELEARIATSSEAALGRCPVSFSSTENSATASGVSSMEVGVLADHAKAQIAEDLAVRGQALQADLEAKLEATARRSEENIQVGRPPLAAHFLEGVFPLHFYFPLALRPG